MRTLLAAGHRAFGQRGGAADAQTFTRAVASIDAVGDLTVKFKETGLAPGLPAVYVLSALPGVSWECIQKRPLPGMGDTVGFMLPGPQAEATLVASGAGAVQGGMVLLVPPSGRTCPVGYVDRLLYVVWTDIRLTELASGASVTLANVDRQLIMVK